MDRGHNLPGVGFCFPGFHIITGDKWAKVFTARRRMSGLTSLRQFRIRRLLLSRHLACLGCTSSVLLVLVLFILALFLFLVVLTYFFFALAFFLFAKFLLFLLEFFDLTFQMFHLAFQSLALLSQRFDLFLHIS